MTTFESLNARFSEYRLGALYPWVPFNRLPAALQAAIDADPTAGEWTADGQTAVVRPDKRGWPMDLASSHRLDCDERRVR